MSNVLLEIGCEEIPARFVPGFLADLKQKAAERLTSERLTFGQVLTLGTGRRLVLYVENLSAKQPDVRDEVKGPPAEISFDGSGKPTAAANGFAQAQKVPVDTLFLKMVNNRNYLFARVTRRGEKSEKVLAKLLPEIIGSLYQPLAMRWGNRDYKFIRPIHSLLALYGNKVIKFELAGVKSGNRTFGHRYLTKKQNKKPPLVVKLHQAEIPLYKKLLVKSGVIVDPEERKTLIRQQVEGLAKKAGAQALINPALLAEVTFLVENPQAFLGKFNPDFLNIPQDALITSMQKNQKYFPLLEPRRSVAGSNYRLSPKFVVITDGCQNPRVVEGNQKVLSARLADARFFFEEDKKVPLPRRLPELAHVAFFEKLGTLQQKTERLKALSTWLGKRLGLKEEQIATSQRIAELCKVDLVTKMVFEFPELQGTMGMEYTLLAGEEPRVALGIAEHYLPRFADDKLPELIESTVVAIADRLDTLVGVFAVGNIPTGSEDPYGLRRAVQGIVRLVMEKKLDLLLDEALDHAYKLVEPLLDQAARQNFSQTKPAITAFIVGRLKPLLLERGIRYDVADAVLYGFNDILDTIEKGLALNPLVKEKWFPGLVLSADRLSRIAGQAPRSQVLEHDLIEKEEKDLYSLFLRLNNEVAERIKQEQWQEAALVLTQLTEPLENFFNKILVMHENERIRLNRLALLKSLEKMYLLVADFRQIVLEGGEKK